MKASEPEGAELDYWVAIVQGWEMVNLMDRKIKGTDIESRFPRARVMGFR